MSQPEITLLDMVMNSLFQYTGAYSLCKFIFTMLHFGNILFLSSDEEPEGTIQMMQSLVVYVCQLNEGSPALRIAIKISKYSNQIQTIKQINKSESKFHHNPGVIYY
jgi:hypothetical protein